LLPTGPDLVRLGLARLVGAARGRGPVGLRRPRVRRAGEIVYVAGVFYGDTNPNEPRLPEIFLMDDDGSNQRQLTDLGDRVSRTDLGTATRSLGEPVLSPDGRRIAFIAVTRCGSVGSYEIFAMDSDGGNKVRLTSNDAFDGDPAFSPDGRRFLALDFVGADESLPCDTGTRRYRAVP
jgi:hypothetical protein